MMNTTELESAIKVIQREKTKTKNKLKFYFLTELETKLSAERKATEIILNLFRGVSSNEK